MDEWVEEWTGDAVEFGESLEWVDEWTKMANRHACYFHQVCVSYGAGTSWSPPLRTSWPSGVEQWRSLVASYFPADQVDRAMRIMSCESGGNPNAKNSGSSASGLFQHLGKYWPTRSAAAGFAGASVFNPTANVATAAWLWRSGGWGHWVCR